MSTRSGKRTPDARQKTEVHLDADLCGLARIGTLFHAAGHGHSVFSFAYDHSWLENPRAFEIDPDLQLHGGEAYPGNPSAGFRIFLDSAPDRWGRLLMDRREIMQARSEKRSVRKLSEWDYLLGVNDACRMGALRFRADANGPFLDANNTHAAPPLARLRELEAASLALEKEDAEDRDDFTQWLQALLAPGSSLGGARPKANFTDAQGALWIAKFPSREDRRDVGAWESVVHRLATKAGITTPGAKLLKLGSRHHTFACRRFDRIPGGGRRFFVSAMTLLGRDDGGAGSYLEIAELLSTRGSLSKRREDLRQLWCRVVFNILVSNRDDHLRNHGCILAPDGWTLAPAYDVNPNLDKAHHHLAIDESDPTPDLRLALDTARYYGLKADEAADRLKQLKTVMRKWRAEAAKAGLPKSQIDAMQAAFRLADS